MSEQLPEQLDDLPSTTPWRATKLVCSAVIITSIFSCVGIAAVRSNGLVSVKVTALAAVAEPRDHGVPLLKQNDALPDYEIIVVLTSGQTINLGAKPNESAINGLTWTLNDPVSISEVVGVRLQDQDKLVSDALTEVQITDDVATSGNYRFEFKTERSASVGVKAFFLTPIGLAISAAFFVGVLIMIVT